MKSIKLLAFLITAFSVTQAQYYEISFSGSGQSNSVDSIQVENLSQGTSLSLNGNDVLLLYGTLGVNNLNNNSTAVSIYPNPMIHSTTVDFSISNSQSVCLEINNASGALITKHRGLVQAGIQRFDISGLSTGIYTLTVSGSNFKYVSKLLSISDNALNPNIKHQTSGESSAQESTQKNTKNVIKMQYNDGEIILFKGFADNYIRVLTLLPTQSQTVNFEFIVCSDEDGNHYSVVGIGLQTWMAENLKTTKYSDGTDIPNVLDNVTWETLTTPAYCWYNNQSNYSDTYGAFYNWYAVDTNILCPIGWHVPSNEEWSTLGEYLIDPTVAGGKLKETGTIHWTSPNVGASNESGFTGRPGGNRKIEGAFDNIGDFGYWWSSTSITPLTSSGHYLDHSNSMFLEGYGINQSGFSVRCLKD